MIFFQILIKKKDIKKNYITTEKKATNVIYDQNLLVEKVKIGFKIKVQINIDRQVHRESNHTLFIFWIKIHIHIVCYFFLFY